MRRSAVFATLIGISAIFVASNFAGASTTPGTPTALAAVPGPGIGQVRLTWSAPTDLGGGITTYLVATAPVVSGVTGTYAAALPTNSTALRVSKSCTATYPDLCAYQVYAKNSAGTSAASTEARIVWTVPSAPRRVRPTSTDFSTVDLTWQAPSRSGGLAYTYTIEKRIDGGSWSGITTGATGVAYTAASSCTGGTSCMYRVKAVNAIGAGSWSNNGALRVTPGVPKDMKVGITATHPETTGASAGSSETLLDWLAPTLGLVDDDYQVQECIDLCNSNLGTWSATTYVGIGAAPSLAGECGALQRTCSYRARSTNTRGGVSRWVYLAIAPFSTTAVSASTGSTENLIAVTFSGSAETGVGPAANRLYRFYVCETTCGTAANWVTDSTENIALDAISSYPFTTDIACTGGTNCLVRMQTEDAATNVSTITNFTSAVGGLFAGAPTGMTVVTGTTSGTVDTSWTAPANLGAPALTSYETRYSTDAGVTFTSWSSTGSTATTRTITCGAGNTCVVEVRAVNAIGTSASASGSAVAASSPGAPTGFSAVLSTGNAALSWTAPSVSPAITDYEYRVSTDTGTTWGSWTSLGTTGTSASITACSATTAATCHYQIRAVNSIGSGASSATSGFTIP